MFDQHAISIVPVHPPFIDNDPLTKYGGFVVPPLCFWWEEGADVGAYLDSAHRAEILHELNLPVNVLSTFPLSLQGPACQRRQSSCSFDYLRHLVHGSPV